MVNAHAEPEDGYPMRINKYLAKQGVATRRGADELIARGKVLVNGRVAVLGDKVNKGDTVELRDKSAQKKFLYYAYNKPVGEVTGPGSPRSPASSLSGGWIKIRAALLFLPTTAV